MPVLGEQTLLLPRHPRHLPKITQSHCRGILSNNPSELNVSQKRCCYSIVRSHPTSGLGKLLHLRPEVLHRRPKFGRMVELLLDDGEQAREEDDYLTARVLKAK